MSIADPNRMLNDIRIATPCTTSWDKMTGNDTVRFCGECKLNVFNISTMTAPEAASLIDSAEGRLCIRLYKRFDGTVITKDCPVGVRRALKRMATAASAVLTLVLGAFSGGVVRAWSQEVKGRPVMGQQVEPREIMGEVAYQGEPILMGKIAAPQGETVNAIVCDQEGHRVTSATIVLENLGSGATYSAEMDEDGRYRLTDVEPGVYSIVANAPGFMSSPAKTVRVRKGQPVRVKLHVEVAAVLMGGFTPEPR